MKYVYQFCFISLLVTGVSQSLYAQNAFDVKKKKNLTVSKLPFKTKHISGKETAWSRLGGKAFHSAKEFSLQSNRVVYSNETSLPVFVETRRVDKVSRMIVRKDATKGCTEYLEELRDVLKLEKPEIDFRIQRIKTDSENRTHIRLNQFYKNTPVYGAEVIVHLNEFGEGEAFNGKYVMISEDIDVVPAISSQFVIDRVKVDASKGTPLSENEKKFVQHAEPEYTLCIYEDKGFVRSNVLAYHVVYSPSLYKRMEYFIDAQTGAILQQFNTVCHVDGPRSASATDLNGVSRTINTYEKTPTFFLLDISRPMFTPTGSVLPDDPIGGILTIDMNNTFGDNAAVKHITSANNVWTNAKAVSAHFNAGFAYNYYLTKHGRNSIDDLDGTIISIINVPDESGQPLDNAFWNGKAMFYGNGATGFKALAGSLDVAGHEMTHGVVQNTANLEYQGESGAINESMADIFGSMMDPADYLIGEDVVKTAVFPSGALRSLSDPHNGGTSLNDNGFQPKHMNEKYNGTEDNEGVHINSGIPNHAFFKIAEALNRDKAAQIFYKALDDYLSKSSQFIDLRLAVIKSAEDLFGVGSNEATQAGIAFDAVGIVNGQGGNFNETLPANPGTEYILVTNTDATVASSLFRILASNHDQQTPLTTTKPISRPSVTDDGTVAVFVAQDNTIHLLVTDPTETAEELLLQDEPIWSNVVISKGGSRIAAVTTDASDNHIYVFDFVSSTWGEFELYNPTFSEGVISGGPVFADALEWDYSGEFLVYDAFNRIVNSDGADIEYWDVNFMRVWDQETQGFADGEVAKLFASLPDGVSIGNPSFAKNSPNVLVFDYIDETTGEFFILGSDAETGNTGTIATLNALGYPTFNKSDTRVAFAESDGLGNMQTEFVTLNSDKISSSGAKQGLFAKTKWPVYFAAGEREIGDVVITAVEDRGQRSLSCYPNPFTNEISVQLTEGIQMNNKVEIYNLLGQRVFDFDVDRLTDQSLILKVSKLIPGQYVVRFRNGRVSSSCKAVKLH